MTAVVRMRAAWTAARKWSISRVRNSGKYNNGFGYNLEAENSIA
jgi:hypothetical protein